MSLSTSSFRSCSSASLSTVTSLVPRASAGRGRGSKFLNFEAARDYMQREWPNVKSILAWKSWCRDGDRPAFIPSHPSNIYADSGWTSFRDFVGHNNRCVGGVCISHRTAHDGRFWFETNVLEPLSEDFEVFQLPRRAKATLLIRRKIGASTVSDDWVALQLKTTSERGLIQRQRDGRSTSYKFSHLTAPAAGVSYAFIHPQKNKASLLDDKEIGPRLRGPQQHLWLLLALSELEDLTLSSVQRTLLQWCDEKPRKTREEWMEQLCYNQRDQMSNLCAQYLDESLYRPLGLKQDFLRPGADVFRGNVLLSGVPCLQRLCHQCKTYSRRGGECYLFQQVHTLKLQPVVKYYVGMILAEERSREGEGVLRGAFIIPYQLIKENHDTFLAHNKQTADKDLVPIAHRKWLVLYPPFLDGAKLRPRSRERQKKQSEYYIDFSTPLNAEKLDKARRLLCSDHGNDAHERRFENSASFFATSKPQETRATTVIS
ncbi:unnamed protein product [Amoebophrya sp. A120]|nr:unnamed protein product [Amoebophrya sp. A120]|eukprot:GSA120T00004555001.1